MCVYVWVLCVYGYVCMVMCVFVMCACTCVHIAVCASVLCAYVMCILYVHVCVCHGIVLSDPTEPFERSVSVARSDISQFKDSKEPNLNDVVDYLASTDPNLVIRAASYLQHLSYGDDSMKAKIRFGFFLCVIKSLFLFE